MRLVPMTPRRGLFDSLFSELLREVEAPRTVATPRLEVSQAEEGYELRFAVPGVDPAWIEVESQGDELLVSGRWAEGENAARFSRRLKLPRDADLARTDAVCRHGILTVSVPRREEHRPRQIPITGR